MAAQRYPDEYDGIMAGAPAVYWSEIETTMFWPQMYMALTNQFPHECELDAIRTLAIDFCDRFDGVQDYVISDPETCLRVFNPFKFVGLKFICAETNSTIRLSKAAAAVSNATWWGPRKATGESVWYGPEIGADLTGHFSLLGQPSVANTVCDINGTCKGQVNDLTMWWYKNFAAKDPEFDYTKLTHEDFDRLSHLVKEEFASFIETDDPDISDFRDKGGKMITYHGLVSVLLFVEQSATIFFKRKKLTKSVRRHHPRWRVKTLLQQSGQDASRRPRLLPALRDSRL
jgi:feruloyl esterase